MSKYSIITVDALVVGTGASGYQAACRIKEDGRKTVAIVTEQVNRGTSRNTGSDKQTYYKLGLSGDQRDSVRQMARDLFAGGSMDGDNALCEAALSARCFLRLCELGVPFPTNRYGEFVGYKTDHDPYARATSVGPLTSKIMTERLEAHARSLDIPVYDHLRAIEILKTNGRVCGLLCLHTETGDFTVFRADHVVLATGGPAGIYADSVYPSCHTGSTGLAISAGAVLQNLTEWQFGLASVAPRWNVSGTYMQVLPRFVSVDEQGVEREFLLDFFDDPYEALSAVFLKGYQWPFDSKKVMEGSSVIDLLVYREQVLRKRRVYLDYRKNPFGLDTLDYEKLSEEAYTYLSRAEACFGTPIQRLEKMNLPAIELYRSKGVMLAKEMLEIALCAQHHNGGIAVDLWWQTTVPGLYAIGECAGTHGVTRPGGSALNAGQVGAVRAAQWISATKPAETEDSAFRQTTEEAVQRLRVFCGQALAQDDNVDAAIAAARRRMSDYGAAIRQQSAMETALRETTVQLETMHIGVTDAAQLEKAYQLQDLLLTQQAVLTSMLDFGRTVSGTRGSALYYDEQGSIRASLEDCFRFRLENGSVSQEIQQTQLTEAGWRVWWRPVRPIPQDNDFFETVWRQYRDHQNIY